MSLIGSTIKPWESQAYHNGDFVDVSTEDFAGRWVIVFFYPGDFTFVCPTELADLEGIYGELQSIGVDVYSVSRYSHFVHKAWHESSPDVSKVTYPMVGDVKGEITSAFDNMRPSGLADRSTYLIDPDGVIQYIETTSEGVGRNATELLRKVKAAQYVRKHPDEVCPAKWEEGDETLTPSFDLSGKI